MSITDMKHDGDRIPGVLDVISVNSLVLLLPALGVIVLEMCLIAYAITGHEYWRPLAFIGIVTASSVVAVAGSLLVIRRVRRIQRLFRHGMVCSGRVVRISADGTWKLGPFRGQSNVMRWCVYEYKIDAKTYCNRTCFESPVLRRPLSPEDVVTVLVDPHCPKSSVLMLLYEE